MGQVLRWIVAGVAVLLVFVLVVVLGGVVVLPHWRALAVADRWVIATAAGVAVAALAALWGQGWATRPTTPKQALGRDEGGRGVTVHGSNTGIIATGDHTANTQDGQR